MLTWFLVDGGSRVVKDRCITDTLQPAFTIVSNDEGNAVVYFITILAEKMSGDGRYIIQIHLLIVC